MHFTYFFFTSIVYYGRSDLAMIKSLQDIGSSVLYRTIGTR